MVELRSDTNTVLYTVHIDTVHTGRRGGTADRCVSCCPIHSMDHGHRQGTWCIGSTRQPAAERLRRLFRRTDTPPAPQNNVALNGHQQQQQQ